MDRSLRSRPGSACQACRRLKMRCEKQIGSPCTRCHKAGRPCVPTSGTQSTPLRRRSQGMASPASSGVELGTRSPPDSTRELRSVSARETSVLPSIYTISPLADHLHRITDDENLTCRLRATSQPTLPLTTVPIKSDFHELLSTDDIVQLVGIFQEKLLPSIKILAPEEYERAADLVANHYNLTLCICYVTIRYLPGYDEVRKLFVPIITAFLQATFNPRPRAAGEDMVDMQALIILLVFTRSYVPEGGSESLSSVEIDYRSVKTAAEASATAMGLHTAGDHLWRLKQTGSTYQYTDPCTRRYVYWIWLFQMSHYTSLVTGTPPTIPIDASIRAAPSLLSHLWSDKQVFETLALVELCLLWEKLGAKDSTLKEWWCSSHSSGPASTDASILSVQEVEAELDAWRQRFSGTCEWHGEGAATASQTNNSNEIRNRHIGSLGPQYHFRFTRFCLLTHFTRRIRPTNLHDDHMEALRRSIGAACDLLEMATHLSPVRREQLRYCPVFVIANVCLCSSFVLKAAVTVPGLLLDAQAVVSLVQRTASLMTDLGIANNSGSFECGRSILHQVATTIDILKQRQLILQPEASTPSGLVPLPRELSDDTQMLRTFHDVDLDLFDQAGFASLNHFPNYLSDCFWSEI